MLAERRRYSRADLRQDHDLHCSSLEADLGGRVPLNVALRLLDVGPRGACLVTAGRLRPGLHVAFAFTPPGSRNPVRVTAIVRWATTVTSGHRIADVAGLEFEETLKATAPDAAPRTLDPHRRHRRFVPGKADLVLVPRGLWTMIGLPPKTPASIKDLGQGGAQVVSSRPLQPGQTVDLAMTFRYPALAVRAEALVRWCRRDTLSLEPRWNVGVVFKKVDPESDSHLKTVEAFFVDPS
jgi:hypothetical protein